MKKKGCVKFERNRKCQINSNIFEDNDFSCKVLVK